jgi:hypothetical protein
MVGIDSVSDSVMCFAISGDASFGSTTKTIIVKCVHYFRSITQFSLPTLLKLTILFSKFHFLLGIT